MSKSKLTTKQKLFVEYYAQSWNATLAAKQAGYQGSDDTLRVVGSENLAKPNIRAAIEERVKAVAMEADEALARVALMARGPDMGKLAEVFRSMSVSQALQKIHDLGLGIHVKRIKETKNGFDIEFYDAQSALTTILKGLGIFKEHMVIDDWRTVAIEEIKAGNVQFEPLAEALGDYDLAVELFRRAGVPVEISPD